jgi:concanavalin A-like lectin/glucanase superfamily protein
MKRLAFILILLCYSLRLPAQMPMLLNPFLNSTNVPSGSGFYVDTNGSDANPGTLAAPWRHIGYALTNSSSGSTIFAGSGETFAENGLTFQHPNTLLSSGAKAVVVSTGTVLSVDDIPNICVSNLFLTGTVASNTLYCLAVYDDLPYRLTNIAMVSCELSNFYVGFAFGTSAATNGSVGLVISNNVVHDGIEVGVDFGTADDYGYETVHVSPLICHNNVYNIAGVPGVNSGYPFGIANCSNLLFANNLFHDSGAASGGGGGGPGGLVLAYSKNALIISNCVYNMHANTNHIDGDGIDLDLGTTNCTVLANYCHDCEGNGFSEYQTDGGNKIGFNVIVGNGLVEGGNARLYSIASLEYFYNNSLAANSVYGGCKVLNDVSTSANKIVNNILLGLDSSSSVQYYGANTTTNWTLAGNLYFNYPSGAFNVIIPAGTQTSLASLRGQGYETNSTGFSVNPFFVSNAAVTNGLLATNQIVYSNSVAISASLDLSKFGLTPPSFDLLGYPIPATGFNLGAINTNLIAGAGYSDVTNGLVSRYIFNSTTTYNDVWGSANGSVISGSFTTTTDHRGNANGAGVFNGCHVSATPLDFAGNYTVCSWIKETGGSSDFSRAISAETSSGSGFYNPAWYNTGSLVFFENSTTAGGFSYASLSGGVATTWNFIVTTYDGTTQTVYVNGVYVTAQTAGANSSGATIIFGGTSYGGNNGANSDIDTVSIYNRALTSTEVNTLWNFEK